MESLIRLSEAMARVSLSREVSAEHVDKAAELISTSITSVANQMDEIMADLGDEEVPEGEEASPEGR